MKTLDDKNEERKHMITEDIEKVNDTMTNVKFRDLLALIENKRKIFFNRFMFGNTYVHLTVIYNQNFYLK